jgi:hypothetical protein
MKFCGQCASPLGQHCQRCGFANPLGFTFCGQGATTLMEQPPAPQPQAARSSTPGHLVEDGDTRVLAWMAQVLRLMGDYDTAMDLTFWLPQVEAGTLCATVA